MEIGLLLDLSCCLLELLDVGAAVTNGVAWSKSRDNRRAIRAAKRAGETPPLRTGWTTTFLLLTPIVIVLTILVLVRWGRILGNR